MHMSVQPTTLELVIGPMFAGKTSTLVARARAWERAHPDARVHVFKPTRDARDTLSDKPAALVTHDGATLPAHVVSNAADIRLTAIVAGSMVVIDEGQMWGGDLVAWLREVVLGEAGRGLTIVVGALAGDSTAGAWSIVSRLVPIATTITHMTATCVICDGRAPFTVRKAQRDAPQFMLGGAELYEPRCAGCFYAPRVVYVVGNIGAGKSTAVRSSVLSATDGVVAMPETIDTNTQIMLDEFYANRSRWAYALQGHFRVKRTRDEHEAVTEHWGPTTRTVVLEGSPFTDTYVFAPTLLAPGSVERTLVEHDERLLRHTRLPLQREFVWIDTPVEVCLARIRERNRASEPVDVDATYLRALHTNLETLAEAHGWTRIDGTASIEAVAHALRARCVL